MCQPKRLNCTRVNANPGGLIPIQQANPDLNLGNYHVSPELDWFVGVGLSAPTGEFDKIWVANLGRNGWSL